MRSLFVGAALVAVNVLHLAFAQAARETMRVHVDDLRQINSEYVYGDFVTEAGFAYIFEQMTGLDIEYVDQHTDFAVERYYPPFVFPIWVQTLEFGALTIVGRDQDGNEVRLGGAEGVCSYKSSNFFRTRYKITCEEDGKKVNYIIKVRYGGGDR